MPTYEYECESCGLKFERRQTMTEPSVTECPKCQGNVHRLVSGGAGFILKGSEHGRGGQRSSNCSLEQMGKTCTCDCVYCRLGRITNKTVERRKNVAVEEVLNELERKLAEKGILDFIRLAKRIGATRVQLNTASRPPAEDFAFPLSTDQMLTLKGYFPGRVDIISENERDGSHVSAFAQARDVDILALLSRRPCTSADVAGGLGIHVTEALKHLAALIKVGKVTTVPVDGRTFYAVVGSRADKDMDA